MRRAILRIWLLLFGVFIFGFSMGQAFGGENTIVEPVVKWAHTSDILRGWPLNDIDEPTQDSVTSGFTLVMGERSRWEMDFTFGYKRVKGTSWDDDWQTASELSLRFYPRRRKR